VQTDLFDCASSAPPLTGLQRHHDELVDLMGQLLWQAASNAHPNGSEENSDEQDQA
jgi:hypothetical protein